jgi:hypothetical protein
MVALVVTECVLQYSLALSNLLQRPSIDLVEAASEAETVISSLLHDHRVSHKPFIFLRPSRALISLLISLLINQVL